MTAEEKSKKYHESIIDNNPHAEAWDFQGAYLSGYNEGYADGLAIEKVPSDKTLLKIIYLLDKGYYLFSDVDGSSYTDIVNYLKEHLYDIHNS